MPNLSSWQGMAARGVEKAGAPDAPSCVELEPEQCGSDWATTRGKARDGERERSMCGVGGGGARLYFALFVYSFGFAYDEASTIARARLSGNLDDKWGINHGDLMSVGVVGRLETGGRSEPWRLSWPLFFCMRIVHANVHRRVQPRSSLTVPRWPASR